MQMNIDNVVRVGIGALALGMCLAGCGGSSGSTVNPTVDKIVFTANRTGTFGIYIMDSNGDNQIRLSSTATGDDVDPRLTADGRKIVFTSNRDAGDSEIYTMNADGSNVRRLTNRVGYDGQAAWSPDGSKIIFATDRDGAPGSVFHIYQMNADGSNPIQLSAFSNDGRARYSPDGSKIVFEASELERSISLRWTRTAATRRN